MWVVLCALDIKNAQITIITLTDQHVWILRANIQSQIYSVYALSWSTACCPWSMVQLVRLATKEIKLNVIHLRFFVEKNVPSLSLRIEIMEAASANNRYPLARLRATIANKILATSRFCLLWPWCVGGVTAVVVVNLLSELDVAMIETCWDGQLISLYESWRLLSFTFCGLW